MIEIDERNFKDMTEYISENKIIARVFYSTIAPSINEEIIFDDRNFIVDNVVHYPLSAKIKVYLTECL